MENNFQEFENSIKSIMHRLDEMENRISKLEQQKVIPSKLASPILESESGDEKFAFPKVLPGVTRVKIFSVIGRTFLVLAGAFLLRIFTENETIPHLFGAVIGLLYAFLWLFFCDKTASKNELFSASFHGIASVLIAFPLILEASTKLSVFTPMQAFIILLLLTGIAMIIAGYRNLRVVYGFYVLASLITSIVLIFQTEAVELFVIYILIIGLSNIVFKYLRNWHTIPWIAVMIVNIMVAFLASLASTPEKLVGRFSEISVTFSLVIIIIYMVSYLGGFITGTLYLKRQISVFGMFQSLMALIIGLIGAISITHGKGLEYNMIGLFAAIFSIGFYLVAFKYLKTEIKVNFYYYAWMAFILAVACVWILCSDEIKIISLGSLSIISILLTKYIDRFNTLSIQSALYIFIAALFASFIQTSVSSLISTDNSWIIFSPILISVLVLSILVYILHILLEKDDEQIIKVQIPRFGILLLMIIGIFGFIVTLSARIFALDGDDLSLHSLALIRTIVLAISAVIIAWLSNKPKLYEFSVLVFPILIIGGIKLLFEDLSKGTPLTLFIGFVFYGFALILAPRIKQKQKK